MPFTTYMDSAILNEFFGGTNYVPPATLYVALSTTAPAKAGTGVTEPTGNGYARVAVTNNATNFPATATSTKNNGTVVTFPEATGSWGNVTHWVIYDASSGGNPLVYGALGASKTVDAGDTASFSPSGLTISLT